MFTTPISDTPNTVFRKTADFSFLTRYKEAKPMNLFKNNAMNNSILKFARKVLLGCFVFAACAVWNNAYAQPPKQYAGNNSTNDIDTELTDETDLQNYSGAKNYTFTNVAQTGIIVSGATNLYYTGNVTHTTNPAITSVTLGGNTLTLNAGTITGNLYGALAAGNTLDFGSNTLNIDGTGSVTGDVIGSNIIGQGKTDSNIINIATTGTVGKAGTQIIGGYVESQFANAASTANNNDINITDGNIQASEIIGGSADGVPNADHTPGGVHGGTAKDNTVTISGGIAANVNVTGGAGNITEGNKVELSGVGTFEKVVGGSSSNAGTGGYAVDNHVKIDNPNINVNGDVRGGSVNYSDSSVANVEVRDNTVEISNGTVNGKISGGYLASNGYPDPNEPGGISYTANSNATVLNNIVTVTGGTVHSVIGGEIEHGGGTAQNNKVILQDNAQVRQGTDETLIIGGLVDQGGKALSNQVTIDVVDNVPNSWKIEAQNIYGGLAMTKGGEGSGETSYNTVTINSGSIKLRDLGTITGGYVKGAGDANYNTVEIDGGRFADVFAIIGGQVAGSGVSNTGNATNNTISIKKSVNGLDKTTLFGGFADNMLSNMFFSNGLDEATDLFTGNKLEIHADTTVGAVANFATISIDAGYTLNVTGNVTYSPLRDSIDNNFGGGLVGGELGGSRATTINVADGEAWIGGLFGAGADDKKATNIIKTGSGRLTLNDVQGTKKNSGTPLGAVVAVNQGVLAVPVKSTFLGLSVDGGKVVITGVTNEMIDSGSALLNVAQADVTTHQQYAATKSVVAENELYSIDFKSARYSIYDGGYYYGRKSRYARMSDNYLAASRVHYVYTMWNATREHLISGNTRWIPVTPQPYKFEWPKKLPKVSITRGQSERTTGIDRNAGIFGNPQERTAWINYVGRSDSFDSSYGNTDWDVKMDGWQAGFDLFRSSRNQLGLLLGFENGNAASDNNRLKSGDHYVGLYAAHILKNGMDARLTFNYGWQEFDSARYNDIGNTGMNYGYFGGNTSEITFELGKRFVMDTGFSMRPVLAFDFYERKLDSGHEVGASPMSYMGTNHKQTFIRTGADFQWQRDNFLVNCGLFWSSDLLDENLTVDVEQRGITNTLKGGEPSRSLATFNINGAYTFRRVPQITAFGGYTIHGCMDGDGNAQNIGYVGGTWRW